MAVKTKKGFKKISKAIAVALFALLMFTNIQVAFTDTTNSNGDFSIFGVEVSLFEDAYALPIALCGDICSSQPDVICTYLVGAGFCFGHWSY